MEIARPDLVRLTAGKAVANTALRWLPFFLPTLAVAFDASTSTLSLLLGVAEACGLTTLIAGRWLDKGRERFVIMIALGAVATASVIALHGSIWAFAATAGLLGGASGYVAVGGHAWISARVPFDRRARFIGIYEMSWATALLIGAPFVALLISVFGWRAPFLAMATAALGAILLVGSINDGEVLDPTPACAQVSTRITVDAWIVIAASAAIAMAGLTTIVVAGTWLDDALGVSTGGVGLVAMAFGLAELAASSGSATFADRLGKQRTTRASIALILVGLTVISLAGSSLLVGAGGLLIFFIAFEYSIVTSFSLVSEAMPNARGRTLGISSALGTLSRGTGVVAAGFLYEHYGIRGPASLSACAAVVAIALLTLRGSEPSQAL